MSITGIDLAPARCLVLDVETGRRRHGGALTRVKSFHTIPWSLESPAELTEALRHVLTTARLSRLARVTIWDLDHTHQLIMLPPLEGRRSAAEANLAALAEDEVRRSAWWYDGTGELIARVSRGPERTSRDGPRIEVAVVGAAGAQIRERIRPIADAGFHIEAVLTPALALLSHARLEHPAEGSGRPELAAGRHDAPGTAVAYLALSATASALAIVRDGVLLFAREMPWGYRGRRSAEAPAALRLPASSRRLEFTERHRSLTASARPKLVDVIDDDDRHELANRLAPELRKSFLLFKQTHKVDVPQVFVCGELPEIRGLTAPLIERLDIEVETLDGLAGIDASALPPPADVFREHVAEYRLAWAAAADPDPPMNLLPGATRRSKWLAAARFPWRRRAAAAAMVVTIALGAAWYLIRGKDEPPAIGQAVRPAAPPRAEPASDVREPVLVPFGESTPGGSRGRGPSGPAGGPERPAPQVQGSAARKLSAPAQAAPESAPRGAPDPVIQSILVGPERRLAIINRRIVGVGDRVGEASVVAIDPTGVVLEDPSGARRRVAVAPPGSQ